MGAMTPQERKNRAFYIIRELVRDGAWLLESNLDGYGLRKDSLLYREIQASLDIMLQNEKKRLNAKI